MKRLFLLTQWFDPEPTFKGLAFAKALSNSGFEVIVITGFPNYPGGKLYPGYKLKFYEKIVIDSVTVIRLFLYPSHNSSVFKRILNYLSFSFSALIYSLIKVKKMDIMYVYHPPLSTGFVSAIVRIIKKTPIVYDIQDIWPDSLSASGMISNTRLLVLIGKITKWVYTKMTQIVVLSPGFKALLIQRGVPESKIKFIPNWCDEEVILNPTGPSTFFIQNDRKKVVFAGNIGKAQGLTSLIEAFVALQSDPVDFIFIGDGLDKDLLIKEATDRKLVNVFFYPRVPMSEIGGYLSQADILLVHLKKDPIFSITIPSKTQAYMAVGKPILMGVEGDASTIIREAKCGVTFEAENPDSFIRSVHQLLKEGDYGLRVMGENAKKYYNQYLSFNTGVTQFSSLFRKQYL